MSPYSYRALARNFYAAGADGVSAYNYMYHWAQRCGLHYVGSPDTYPHALSYLKEMRDPDDAAAKSRHYVFLPFRNLHLDYPGVRDRSSLYRPMTREPWKPGRGSHYGQEVFRMAEDFEDGADCVLRFRAMGLVPEDEILVVFNNEEVPTESIRRTYYPHGRDASWDDDSLPPTTRRDYSVCEFTPIRPAETGIEHVLGIELTRSADGEPSYNQDGSLNRIYITEVELCAAVGGDRPDEIMSLIREKVPGPMPVLAGYHPHLLAVWREKTEILSFTQNEPESAEPAGELAVDFLAQSFDLAKPATVEAIDVLLQPDLRPIKHTMFHAAEGSEIARAPVVLSLRRDRDGVPDDQELSDGSRVVFVPWDHSDELLNTFQGYYVFRFPEALQLEAGKYWIVLGRQDAAKDELFLYQALLAPKDKYRMGDLLAGPGQADKWMGRQEMLFFGVHAPGGREEST